MTDPLNPQPGSYRTSGYGAGAGEESRTAANSGRASVRPRRPGAASPAGWFPPTAGEAAPPVRLREPARSDGASPYDMETRPTAMYRVPWQTARQERLRRSLEKLQTPIARPAGLPDDGTPGDGSPSDVTGAPDARWPSLTGRGPRHVPVVGPTEALRGRPGGPRVDAPPGAVPGLPDHERESGWQLAQRVWQDSGVDWEWEDAPAQSDYAAPGPYAPASYGADQYSADPYSAEAYARPFAADTYGPDSYPPDTGGPASYPGDADDFDADPYPAGDPGAAHQYSAAPHAASQYLPDSHPTRPDLPVLREPADSLLGMGPWPVQQPPRT